MTLLLSLAVVLTGISDAHLPDWVVWFIAQEIGGLQYRSLEVLEIEDERAPG